MSELKENINAGISLKEETERKKVIRWIERKKEGGEEEELEGGEKNRYDRKAKTPKRMKEKGGVDRGH